ncbi:MAG TPA: hypothetical protein VFW47_10345, partial [Phenylobacterium sp.]|nr:hypothetical protein [Phenylobacterium sp.]
MSEVEMSRERFEALAEAHGGAVARWPVAERRAAQALAAAEPEFARAVLARAEQLDAVLDAWRPLAVGHELRERSIAGAAKAVRRHAWVSWVVG